MNLLKFLYWLQKKEFYLWIENDSLKFKQLQPLKNKDEILSLLKSNKDNILNILKDNNIHSQNIKYPYIYKTNKELVPLSFAQERLFFIDQYEKGTNAYNIPILFKLKGKTDTSLFIRSIEKIIEKHEVLRTVYTEKNGNYFQKIIPQEVHPYTELKIKKHIAYTKKEFDKLVQKSVECIFDLKNTFPIKIDILKFNRQIYVCIVVHHIAFDGWSSDIFLNDLEEFYNVAQAQYLTSEKTEERKIETQYFASDKDKSKLAYLAYKDFAEWQKYYLTGKTLEKQLSYWKNQLAGHENLNLPTDKPRQPKTSYSGNDYLFKIDTAISAKIKKLAKKNNTTLYCILLSAYYILLHKYTQQNDLIVGTPIANRHYNQIENLIGFFVNTLPIRIQIDEEKTIKTIIQQVTSILSKAQSHQDIPFEKIVNELNVEKDLSRNAIFQVMFSLQDINDKQHSKLYSVTPLNKFNNIAKFNLNFTALEKNDDLNININYATSLYEHSTIKRMANHYINILKSLTSNTDAQIKELNILSLEEYQMIVYDWNKTEAPYPKDKTIHQLFEEQVEKTPDNIAVVFEDKNMTYKELNEKADKLALIIKKEYKKNTKSNIKIDTLIPICVEKSFNMIICIIGILKSGGAYVPINPKYPIDRIKFILEDTDAKIILTQSRISEKITETNKKVKQVILDEIAYPQIIKSPNLQITKSTDLAYCIYTSGTTGKPKGVIITHKNLVNLIVDRINEYNFNYEKEKILFFSNYTFDASIEQIFIALLTGGTLHIPDTGLLLNIHQLEKYLINNKITHFNVVPLYLETMTLHNNYYFNRIVVGGDVCPSHIAKKWNRFYTFINNYGPTETTINATSSIYQKNKPINKISIGRPLHNYKAYILDHLLQPVPIGVHGELYISGVGTARGYINDKGLTKTHFLKNPFIEKQESDFEYNIIYKTGDIVKWLSNSSIEYCGRIDKQIKLRGFRVELGEIESKLSEYPKVNQCTVTVHNQPVTNNKTLVAYYTTNKTVDHRLETREQRLKTEKKRSEVRGLRSEIREKDQRLETRDQNNQQPTINSQQEYEEDLRKYLTEKLPDYMVPNIFVRLDKMPLNTSGKIDRKSLPNPNFKSSDSNYIPPKTKIEKRLVDIWQKMLGINKIGINENYFKIGGNSLLSIKLSSQIHKTFEKQISISEIFQNPTIKSFASNVLEQDNIEINIPLLSTLKRDYANFTKQIDYFNLPYPSSNLNPKTILLTGATGFLGIYLLDELLNKTKANIYCLIRKDNKRSIKKKFYDSLTYYNKKHLLDNDRIVLVEGNLSKEHLGISKELYSTLIKKIDSVYHNGTHVNHLYNYETLFDENVKGSFEVIKMATTGKTKNLFYISTYSIANLPAIKKLTEKEISSFTGYTQTKYLSEQILLYANSKGTPIKIFRPGNITGDIYTGISNYSNNHSLLILKAYIQMGMAPKTNSSIEMTSINTVSKAIVNISFSDNKYIIFNLNNNNTISWIDYINKINNYGYTVKLIPPTEWIQHLASISKNNAMYPFKEHYLELFKDYKEENIKEKNIPGTDLKEFGLKYPSDYDSLVDTYTRYLQKVGFLPKPE